MSLLPDMPDIQYLNIADNTMTNLDGLVPISHSITRYTTLEEIDVSGLDLDVSPLADISSLQTVYAVAKPSDTLFHKTDITALYGMYKNGVKWYLYDKATKLNPTSSVEGAKILNEIKDFSCSITVAADNVISDNNPFIVDKVNDYDITWSLSNSKNYEIVNNHLSVKDYSDIEDEKLTVTATITVYPDQSTVSRDFTINTHILRVSNANTNYYTFNTTGMDDNLTRTSDFTYDIALKSADTTGFTGKVKPVETEIRYSIKSVLKDGKTVVPSSNVITDKGNHSYTVTSRRHLITWIDITTSSKLCYPCNLNQKCSIAGINSFLNPLYINESNSFWQSRFMRHEMSKQLHFEDKTRKNHVFEPEYGARN